jgi:hypothetical protein
MYTLKLQFDRNCTAVISRRMNRLKNSGSLTELKQIMEWMENYGSHVS